MSVKIRRISIKKIISLLTPSAISSVICVVASLIFCLGIIFINRYRSNELGLQSSRYVHQSVSSSLTGTILTNKLVENLPMIIIIILAIILVSLLLINVSKVIKAKPQKEDDRNLFKNVILPLILRIVVLAIWLLYLMVFFNSILYYTAKLSILAATASDTLAVIGYILLTVVITSVSSHVNVILLRLLFLKDRLLPKL